MFEDLFKIGGLSHERLNTLLKLSEAGSLIKAANDDFGRQSRLSHHLRELSEYFGIELTEKAGRSVKLTAAGQSLVQITREHFLALQSFRNQAAAAIPTIRIAAGDSLLQWLLVPAIGRVRRPNNPIRFQLTGLRTNDIVEYLTERRIDFGLLRANALEKPLKHVVISEQHYAIFVPQRLVPTRGMLTMRVALLDCPHAAIGGDGQLLEQLRELAGKLGGVFIPELVCDSIGQCVAAVETGVFAAVLPVQVRPSSSGKDYVVVEDDSLDTLKRQVALAWHPRTADVAGPQASKLRQALVDALKQQGAQSEHYVVR
jgi:LysR family transcriptional regulator, nitrogen assimilation regulatory protein